MGASFILGICSVPRHQDPVPPVKIIWGDEAEVAVAYVVLNRVARRIRGTDVCEVVWAPHQFSWTRHPTPIRDTQAWRQAWQIATLVLEQAVPNPVGPADHYHADRISVRIH